MAPYNFRLNWTMLCYLFIIFKSYGMVCRLIYYFFSYEEAYYFLMTCKNTIIGSNRKSITIFA